MASPAKPSTPRRSAAAPPGGRWGEEGEADSPLPPLQERLAYLRPSRELLDFYRHKISCWDEEQHLLLQTLERYRGEQEEQHKLQVEVRQREEEISELQAALSDMQVFLFQEREQSLRLYAENDRLKIRELEDRKKIQNLLVLVGPDAGEITYFHREPPSRVRIPQKSSESEESLSLRPSRMKAARKERRERSRPADEESLERYKNDNQTLLLQVEALQAQMEEQARLAREQLDSLMEERRIRGEEEKSRRLTEQRRVDALSQRLRRSESLLHESTRDFLQLKFSCRSQEKVWMQEKDRLLRELDGCHARLRAAGHAPNATAPDGGRRPWRGGASTLAPPPLPPPLPPQRTQQHKEELKTLTEDLKQSHRLAEMYREQCVSLEAELSQIREEGDVGREIFKERSDKMASRLQLMTQRYEALERRRVMEVEGFKTDLKLLRQKLKDVEKQLLKVTLNVGPNQDLAILQEVRQTNTRTRKVQNELTTLKAKIYGLENQLRVA